MLHRAITTLRDTLRPHLGLGKDRVETLALIKAWPRARSGGAMVSARTVNLSHLAAERPGATLVASTYRRLQRFFQYVRLEPDWAAPITAGLAGLRGSGAWYLALDLAWAARAARDLLGTRWPKRKAHGYLAKSWFRTGFDRIRNLLRSDPMEAIQPWCRTARKPRQICRVVWCVRAAHQTSP